MINTTRKILLYSISGGIKSLDAEEDDCGLLKWLPDEQWSVVILVNHILDEDLIRFVSVKT